MVLYIGWYPLQALSIREFREVLWQRFFLLRKNSNYKVYSGPFDIRLVSEDGIIRDTVQPDISVICDPTKLDSRGCVGAPDLVVEILSASSSQRDLRLKYDLYRKHGVKEYWVVHPEEKTMLIYTLDDKQQYQASRLYTRGDIISSKVFKCFTLDLDEVFDPFDWDKVAEREATYNRM
ncbi:MAG: Uma2 family endonuclease [Saprospiraceae bacterium]|jgi:Uma2 family endonuclease